MRSEFADLPGGRGTIRWGAVFAGTILGVALMTLFTMLWLALAYGSNQASITEHLNWWLAGTAIGAMFLGGLLAGWLAGRRGVAVGLFHGMTVWGLLLIVGVAVGVPAVFHVTTTETGFIAHMRATALWTEFWAMLIGLGAASIGGVFGGVLPALGRAGGEFVEVPPHEHEIVSTTAAHRRAS